MFVPDTMDLENPSAASKLQENIAVNFLQYTDSKLSIQSVNLVEYVHTGVQFIDPLDKRHVSSA